MTKDLEKNKAIELLKALPAEEREKALIEIKPNINALSNNKALSDNQIASHNRGINVNLLGENNTFYWSIFGKKTNDNLERFINLLPIEIKNAMTIEDDLSLIHEVLKQASMSSKFHIELRSVLEKYLNTEQDTNKLQIKKVLDILPFLNKKLLKVINILEHFYTKEQIDVFYYKPPYKEAQNLINDINDNLDFLKSINSDEITILKENNLLIKLPFNEEKNVITTVGDNGPNDPREVDVTITEQIQGTSINWKFLPEHIYAKEDIESFKEQTNNAININKTLIKDNELDIFTLSPTAKLLSKINVIQ